MRGLPLLALLIVLPAAALAADLPVSARMHHLRSRGIGNGRSSRSRRRDRSCCWRSTRSRTGEHTLRLRHRDLKQPWRVLLNGQEIARLPLDEADMVTYWAIPPGTLRTAGTNCGSTAAGARVTT